MGGDGGTADVAGRTIGGPRGVGGGTGAALAFGAPAHGERGLGHVDQLRFHTVHEAAEDVAHRGA